MSTIGTVIDWISTGINWVKKGARRGKINKIRNATSNRDADAVNDIVSDIEKARDKRTSAS